MQEEWILHIENGNHIAAFDYVSGLRGAQSNPFTQTSCATLPQQTKFNQRVKIVSAKPAIVPSPDTNILKQQQQEKEKQETEEPGFFRKYVSVVQVIHLTSGTLLFLPC